MNQSNIDTFANINGISSVVDKNELEQSIKKNLDNQLKAQEKEFYQNRISRCDKIISALEKKIKDKQLSIVKFQDKPNSDANKRLLSRFNDEKTNFERQLQQEFKNRKKFELQIKELSEVSSVQDQEDLVKKGLATPFDTAKSKLSKSKKSFSLDDAFGLSLTSTSRQPAVGLPSTSCINLKKRKIVDADEDADEDAELKRLKLIEPKKQKKKLIKTNLEKKLVNDDSDYSPKGFDFDSLSDEEFAKSSKSKKVNQKVKKKVVDDGKPENYKKRIKQFREKQIEDIANGYVEPEDKCLDQLRVPGRIWNKLYKYQRIGVKWLWELHQQRVGGILGDEMGLGKTVQIISFLAALRHSGLKEKCDFYNYSGLGPVMIVTPATLMQQWVSEIHRWLPQIRVAILHQSGSHSGERANLIYSMVKTNGVLITSYDRVRLSSSLLMDCPWHYVILDEGHKIRNPESAVTRSLKMVQTCHRILLSGSPIQNNLRELWSLFDFVYPGKLGTMTTFMEQLSVPIIQGGYLNASETEVETGYKCAVLLRDTINPYLLRRLKGDVQTHLNLPQKKDQVLFCMLSEHQVKIYKEYLNSEAIRAVLHGKDAKVLVGLLTLRKICNHPDLHTGGHKLMVGDPVPDLDDERSFGFWKRSGKMCVVESLLRSWKKDSHKVLLFTQSRKMLKILEKFLKLKDYSFVEMHGQTSISERHKLVHRFNQDPTIFIFLLTTRVGGLGVNLTGADRVVIFDPDWNPSTDAQAQERAWRIGQDKPVNIYRLITTGSIEEKIYHRQIFKQLMSDRVLKDPRQSRFFKQSDLRELFTLKDQDVGALRKTETSALFSGTGSEVDIRKIHRKQKKVRREAMTSETNSDDKLKISLQRAMAKFRRNHANKCDVDGCEVTNVVRKSRYKPEPDTRNSDYVLSKLFKKGVTTVMKHDVILSSSNYTDYVIVENEADRVAKSAVKNMKDSRKFYKNPLKQRPRNLFGNQKSKQQIMAELKKEDEDEDATLSLLKGNKDAKTCSSSSILMEIRKRNAAIGESSSEDEEDAEEEDATESPLALDPGVSSDADKDLLKKIIDYFKNQSLNATVTTDELIKRFKPVLPLEQTPIFKALINRVCEKISLENGTHKWKLKYEHVVM